MLRTIQGENTANATAANKHAGADGAERIPAARGRAGRGVRTPHARERHEAAQQEKREQPVVLGPHRQAAQRSRRDQVPQRPPSPAQRSRSSREAVEK